MLGQVMRTRLGEHPPSRPASGLTFVELMITLTVLGVLVAIAVPSMREFIARQRVQSIAKEVATDLRFLRTQAIQRQLDVRIAFGANDNLTCYVMFGMGDDGENCSCARSDGLPPCGSSTSSGRSVEFKTVIVDRSRGIVLSATPNRLLLAGLNGMPKLDPLTNKRTIAVSVRGVGVGGEIQVFTSDDGLVVPRLCSVSGHQGSLPACSP